MAAPDFVRNGRWGGLSSSLLQFCCRKTHKPAYKWLISIGLKASLTILALTGAAWSVDLVSFERTRIAEVGRMMNIVVFAKLDDRAIGLLKGETFPKLAKHDQTAVLLEKSADIDLLWVTGRDNHNSDIPGLLLETENFRLLELAPKEAMELMRLGVTLSKCHKIDLPVDPPFYIPAKFPPVSSLTADIDSLVALVSVDSIQSYIQWLQDSQTRYTCTDSFWVSGQWIADKFAAWGYGLIFKEFPTLFGCDSRNVIATKNGDLYPDRFIIVGGHYDAVVYDGGDPAIYAPGADDNASGTAMAMEIARVLAGTQTKLSVRFIAFGAEEQGMLGSWYYVNDALYRDENIEYMVNADMIGNLADNYLNFALRCNQGGQGYGQVLSDLAQEYTTLIPEMEIGEFYGSDQYPFDQSGFRTIYSEEGDFSPNWHYQSDIIDNIDIPYAADIIRANLAALLVALESPVSISGMTAYNRGDGHTVILEWEPSSDFDVIGYEVYFGMSEDDIAVYDTAFAPADTVFNLEENSLYYFGVAAYTANGARGPIDNFASIIPRSIPTRADTLYVTPQTGRLLINWAAVPDLDFSHYQLYRRIGSSGDFIAYRQIQTTQFIDNNLRSNTRYYYYVTLVDSTGLESEPSAIDYSKVISLDTGILLVDETRDYSGGPGRPTDAEQDSFYAEISNGYRVTFHDIASDGAISIRDIGPYSTIVWLDDDPLNQYLADMDDVLGWYLDLGGNLLYAGWRAFADYNQGRPLEFDYDEFPNRYLDIIEVNCTIDPDFSAAIGSGGWPDMQVQPEKVLRQWNGLLIGIDVMTLEDRAQPIYSYQSASGDTAFQGRPVGITMQTEGYSIVYLTFPLFVMPAFSAGELFASAMNLFGEQRTAIDEYGGEELSPIAFLSQNYPNPFNAETKIRYRLTMSAAIRLAVYNILGQEIAVLAAGEFNPGIYSVSWTGPDLPSGVYFYRLTIGEESISRRMILLR